MRKKKWLSCFGSNVIIFIIGYALFSIIGYGVSQYYIGIIAGILMGMINFIIIWS